MDKMIFSPKKMRHLWECKGMSRRKLAQKVGRGEGAHSKIVRHEEDFDRNPDLLERAVEAWEDGVWPPSDAYVEKIAVALGCNKEDLAERWEKDVG